MHVCACQVCMSKQMCVRMYVCMHAFACKDSMSECVCVHICMCMHTCGRACAWLLGTMVPVTMVGACMYACIHKLASCMMEALTEAGCGLPCSSLSLHCCRHCDGCLDAWMLGVLHC